MSDIKAKRVICPECGEPAQNATPERWRGFLGTPPGYSHLDGEPLCPVMGPTGYRPAKPRYIY